MQQETTTALEIFEAGLTKSDIKQMAVNAFESVKDQGNILQVAEAASAMEQFIKELKDIPGFKDYVREETVKYGKSYVSASGAKIEIAETGSTYDFGQCNDPVLSNLEKQFEDAKKKLDERKAFLKNIPGEGMELRYDDELITVFRPSKTSISSYKVSLAK